MINKGEIITSRQNAGIKRACALLDKKSREAERLFRFDGSKLFCEAVAQGVFIERVYIEESAAELVYSKVGELVDKLDEGRVSFVADHVFSKMTEEKSPEGIITIAKYIDKSHKLIKINNEEFLPLSDECVMLLESIRDPGNLGTMIRSAAALGIDRLIISSDCADIYNPKTIRAAMGGLFKLRIDKLEPSVSMAEYITKLRSADRHVYAAALSSDAVSLSDNPLDKGDCIVVGNEGHGLSSETIKACDRSVIIPMEEDCESLNAAAVAVIFMWELRRTNK